MTQTPDSQTPTPPTPDVPLAVRNRRRLISNIPTMLLFLAVTEGFIFTSDLKIPFIHGTYLDIPLFFKVILALMPLLVIAAAIFIGFNFEEGDETEWEARQRRKNS